MSTTQIFLCFLLLVIVYIGIKSRRRLRLPPGPWQLPILGYLPFIDEKNPYLTLTTLAKKYGQIYGIKMGSVYAVILSDHRLVRQVLAKEEFAGRAPLYLTHGIMKGYGLICAEGHVWREQRRFVTACLKDFGTVKYSCGKRDKLEERILTAANEAGLKLKERGSNKEGIDPFDTLHHCLGNLINDLVFGVSYEEDNEIWKMLQKFQDEGVKYMGVAGPLNFLPFLRHFPRYKNVMKYVVDGQTRTHEEYKKIINNYENQPTNADNFLAAFVTEMKKRNSTGEIGSFADPQIFFLLADMFGAGVDTTITTLRWFLLFMAVYPNEQEEILKEMDNVLCGRGPTLNDRPSLPRLEAAIAETQRIRSIVPLGFPHGCMKDAVIEGYDIPKGTMIVPLQWAIHMDPKFWPEPEIFRPARFLTEEGNLAKPDAFMPFQSGKRICVGEELAKMILFLFTARILQSFFVSVPPGSSPCTDGECGITLTPKPHHLVFKHRM
ncbi:cytochrome P450 306a1 [Belonocnema kinseyi]|uniref:cytochrome P450 306a1 n=1 Tax=Belonocnema kinseyi TaxID=2817044 RepID=UPI00143DCB34|nr:cytochrome P450 306a1 [Belonocnema kinseyi]